MFLYMIYLFVGQYIWSLQVVVVVTLSALAWRTPGSSGWSQMLAGRSATATGIAAVFAVLMIPVVLMIILRRNQRDFPTSFTDPPGIACMVQAVLLVAAGVNTVLVNRAT